MALLWKRRRHLPHLGVHNPLTLPAGQSGGGRQGGGAPKRSAGRLQVSWLDKMQTKNHYRKLFKHTEVILLSHRVEVGRWSNGRPVFKKVGWSRFLLVQGYQDKWTIREFTFHDEFYIQSGKETNLHLQNLLQFSDDL